MGPIRQIHTIGGNKHRLLFIFDTSIPRKIPTYYDIMGVYESLYTQSKSLSL